MSTIDLGDCEYLLRINNNLTNNQTISRKRQPTRWNKSIMYIIY